MYSIYKKTVLFFTFCLIFSKIYSNNKSNANAVLSNVATGNILHGGNLAGYDMATNFLNLLSCPSNNNSSEGGVANGVIASATTAAVSSNLVPAYPRVRLEGLLFNGNDVTIVAATDPRSTTDVVLHTPSVGDVRILLDRNPYDQPLIGLTIIQDKQNYTFVAQGDISLDYALNIASHAKVTCTNDISVLSGIGGVFVYIEEGCSLSANTVLFDGKNQSAVRNYGLIKAISGDIVIQNTLGVAIWAGVENHGFIRALAGSILMNNNQGGDTAAAICNYSCITAQQNISMNFNTAGANNRTICNRGTINAQYDLEIINNQCGINSFALYNETSGQINAEDHYITISNNNDIVNYGIIAAPLQLTFQGNVAVTSTGVLLQDSGLIQSDTIQFINNSGLALGSGVEMNGTIYSYDNIIITIDCTSANQNVLIQTPFYLCNSDKQALFPGSNVIINNTGSCAIYPILSVLGDIVFDGDAKTISITVPSSDSISDYITTIGQVSVYVPSTGELMINGVPYADTVPGLTVIKTSSLLEFDLISSLIQSGSITLVNNAQALIVLGLFTQAKMSGNFVNIGTSCLFVSLLKIIFDGAGLGSFVNNGLLATTNYDFLPGGDIVVKNNASGTGPAVMQNGAIQTPALYSILFKDNASTSDQGVFLTNSGGIRAGTLVFNNNIGAELSYGLEAGGILQTNSLNVTADCSETNQRFAINTTPMLYDNSGPLPEEDITINNTGCPI